MLNMCEYIKFLNKIQLIFLVLEDWGMLLVFTVMPIWAAIRGQWRTRCWLEAGGRATGDRRLETGGGTHLPSHLHILSPGPPRIGAQYSTPSTLHSGKQSQIECKVYWWKLWEKQNLKYWVVAAEVILLFACNSTGLFCLFVWLVGNKCIKVIGVKT